MLLNSVIFSQGLEPKITLSATGDTLFTWTEPQAKEIAILLKEGQHCREELVLEKAVSEEYRSKTGELANALELEHSRFLDTRKLYTVEVDKYMPCETNRVTTVTERDKAQEKLTKVKTKLWLGYGIAAVFLTTTLLK